MLSMIAFDADDTLWHNEPYYIQAGERFAQLLSGYRNREQAEQALAETEMRNVRLYGYGIKSYTLSMVEAAIAVTGGEITGSEIQAILEIGQEMLAAEVLLFEGVSEVLAELASAYALMLITKGDLLEQGNKLDRSGLAGYFRHVEIIQEKSAASYQRLLERYAIQPAGFLMVGNSLKSDILPVIEIGGRAVYIPYEHTWTQEQAEEGELQVDTYEKIEHLRQLPGLITHLEGKN
jgi:putative hydrolase of the HAD superfamily